MSLNTNLPYCSNAGVLQGQFLTLNVTGGASFSVDSNGTATLALPATGVTSLTGTANQVNVSASTGAVTLSLPQSIANSSSPTFSALTITNGITAGGTSTSVAHNLLSSTQVSPATNFTTSAYLNVGGSGGNYLSFGQYPGSGTYPYAQWLQSGYASSSSVYYGLALNPSGGSIYLGSACNVSAGGTLSLAGTIGFVTGTSSSISASPNSYGSIAVSSSTGGWAGIDFTGSYQDQHFMVSATANRLSGMWNPTTGWDWYWTNGTLTTGTVPAANISGTVASATTAAACSGTSTYINSTSTASGSGIDVALINGTSIQYSSNFYAVPSTGVMTAAGGFTVSSDRNKKDNIRLIENSEYIIQQLNGVKFDWKNTGLPSVGVIAQDVESVLPELVYTSNAGTKSVNYDGLIGVLIEAVKSLTERVAQLEAK